MKKIATIALLPMIWLTSCGQTQTQEEVILNTTENDNLETQDIQTNETQTENLNENITQTENDSETNIVEQAFDFNYEIWGNTVPVSWKFILENWVVKEMIINGADVNWQTPLDSFAKNAPEQVVGKALNGLQVDSVSGATYVTVGFNQFLSTLQ